MGSVRWLRDRPLFAGVWNSWGRGEWNTGGSGQRRQRSGRQKEGLEYFSANGPEERIESPVEKQKEESRLPLNNLPLFWIRIWDPDTYFTNPHFKFLDLSYFILDFILLNYRMIWPILLAFGSVKSKEQVMNLGVFDSRVLGIVSTSKFGRQKEGIENTVVKVKAIRGEPAPAPYNIFPDWIVDPDLGSASFC